MISELTIWYGTHVETYQDNLDDWLAQRDDIDTEFHHCEDIHPDNDEIMFEDTGGALGGKTVLLIGGERWYAATVAKVKKRYDQMDTDVRLGIVYRGEEAPAALAKAAEIRDFRISFDEDGLTEWMVDWMKEHGTLIDEREARKAVRYAGSAPGIELMGKIVSAAVSVTAIYQNEKVTAEQIINEVGDKTEVEAFDWVNAVISGDRKKVAEMFDTMKTANEFGLLGMLTSKFRPHAALASNRRISDNDLGTLGVGKYAARFVRNELRLSEPAAIRCMQLINKADGDLKGNSYLDNHTIIMSLGDSLANICHKAHNPRR